MIRDADIHDLPVIADLAGPVMAELQPCYPFHAGSAVMTLRRRIDADAGLVSVVEIDGRIAGGLTGEVAPALWSRGLQAVCDLRWIDPAYRGRWGHALMRHFETWAEARGARILGVSQTGREATGYYERLGYHPAEMMFWKGLES